MRLNEYQAKAFFAKVGIPVPKGQVVTSPVSVKHIAEEFGNRVVCKAQVLVGGRGAAGGILLAKNPEEAKECVTRLLGMQIKGLAVRKVLVEEAISITQEMFLGVMVDRSLKKPLIVASASSGVEIEEVALRTPEKVIRLIADPLIGLRDFQIRELAIGIDLERPLWRSFAEIARGVWQLFIQYDALFVEVNPLVITQDQRLMVLDGKIVIDDNALSLHHEMIEMMDVESLSNIEFLADQYGLSYTKLNGNIGCMVNGSGLSLLTMDLIDSYGGLPANFLDIGGSGGQERVETALKIILMDSQVTSVLVNVFGGITRCDEVARGIIASLDTQKNRLITEGKGLPKFVVRLAGTNAVEGMELLHQAQVETEDDLEQAVRKAVLYSQVDL